MMEIRETMKKVVIFTVKGCYRSVCNHPFFAGVVCFLVFLYSSFPFLFSLLVSASPVIVCTAILLGTLLSFGNPNIPEFEREERTTREIVSLKIGVSQDSVVFGRNESVSVERYGDKGKSVVGALIRESSSVENEISGAGSDGGFGHVLEKMSKEMKFDEEERRGEFGDLELESKSEMFGEKLGDITIVENHYSLIPEVDDEHIDLEDDRSLSGSVDSKMVNVDCLDSPPSTPWRHVNQEDEEENEDDDGLDSGSDRAESSSPDASLADILPVLDELHPLLDGDTPHPVNLSHDGSYASSEQSARSDESSNESDDDTETQVSEVGENGNDDGEGEGEDEEEAHQDEEDQTKSAIRWTEEDERNLMDLGSSELERNQRLENLIARRRARKTMSVMPETNFIDLETTDFTFNVPPILTTRNNPFDISQNSYEDMGLPPIPGSAPSVLLHRRNPFDIPYDSSEEKPDLMEDSFQQEFTPFQSKEHFFRRHESFNSWRTPFGINKPEKQDMSRFRPYFVEDRLGSEGTSFSPFQRQSSGVSDSKASSVPDTGSVSSSGSTEEWNVNGEETSAIEDGNIIEEDITRELDLITRTELASELAGHGSESSEEENSIELSQVETILMKDDVTERKFEDTGYKQEAESSLVVEQRLANQFKTSSTETYSNVEAHEQIYKSSSSSSLLSEESERIYVEKEVEAFPSFIGGTYHSEDSSVSAQPSLQGSHLNITAPLRDDAFRVPVYDLSPSSVNKFLPRSSNSSEIDLESSGFKKTVSFSEIVTMIGSQELESDSIVDKEVSSGSSETIQVDESQMASSSDVQITNLGDRGSVTERISAVDIKTTEHNDVNYVFSEDSKISASPLTSGIPETEIRSAGYMEIAEFNDVKYDLSESDKISASATSSVTPETVLGHIEKSSSGSSLDPMYEDVTPPHSTSVGTNTDIIQSLSEPRNELNLAGSLELDSADTHSVQSIAHHTAQEESMLSEKILFQSSFDRSDHEDKALTSPRHQFPSAESSGFPSVEDMAPSQNSFYESSSEDLKESQKSKNSAVESVWNLSTTDSWSNYNIPHIDNKLPLNILVPTGHESTAVPAEVFGFQSVEELDEINEIDEHLLEELDTVGDFRAKEFGGLDDPVVDAEEVGSTIKEFDQYDEDAKHVSEFERSVMDSIDPFQYDGIGLDDSGHLVSAEDNFYSKAEQTDFEVNSLAEISDIEENDAVMAEIEAHFAKTIEAMIIQAELTSEKTGVMHIDPPPSFVDLAPEESSTADSESITTGKILGEAKIQVETQAFQHLDLNRPQEENVEQVRVSSSVLTADGAEDMEVTLPELLVSETQSLNDSDSALKQESRTSSSEALGFAENVTVKDVQADLDSPRKSKSGVEESDVMKTLQHSLEESDIVEAKTPESDDVLIVERKSMDDSFSALKKESHSFDVRANLDSPRESKSGVEESDVMKTLQHSLEESDVVEAKTPESDDVLISEIKSLDDSFSGLKQESHSSDVRANLDSPRESKSGVEESDVMKILQHSLEESNIVEAKKPESDDVILSERKSLDDSFSVLKQESQSSPSEALKSSEDVPAAIYSPSKAISGAEDSDVKIAQQNSLEEQKLSESHDVLISERHSSNDSDSTLKKESQSSPSEASKLPEEEATENIRANIDSPMEANPGIEESEVGNDIKESDKKSSSSSSSSSSYSSSSDSDRD